MGFAAKKKPEPTPDLAGEILQLRGLIDSYVDSKMAVIKASKDGESLPIESIRLMLTQGTRCQSIRLMLTQGTRCPCTVAMQLLAEENNF